MVETDATGAAVVLDGPARRIISLVPSQTELLHDLGLGPEVVGITRFCVHPADWHRDKPRVGGTKDVRVERVRELSPDLVLANREENVREQVEAIREFCPVWTSDVSTREEAIGMIRAVGRLTGRAEAAAGMTAAIRQAFDSIPAPLRRRRTAYLIWKNPWMAAGGATFIDDMLRSCGFDNVFAERPRYPVIDLGGLADLGTELVLLSSEPFPFGARDLSALRMERPGVDVRLVDGEMFSWYGSRMLKAARYLSELVEGGG